MTVKIIWMLIVASTVSGMALYMLRKAFSGGSRTAHHAIEIDHGDEFFDDDDCDDYE